MNAFDEAVRKHWDENTLALELSDAEWEKTEPGRRDRRVWLGSYRAIVDLTEQVVSEEEWAESDREGFREELVDDYLDAIERMMTAVMGNHVYSSVDEGDVFIGQYEDIQEPEPAGPFDWEPEA